MIPQTVSYQRIMEKLGDGRVWSKRSRTLGSAAKLP